MAYFHCSLLEEVLQRLEAEEEEGTLLQATLCLLEASTTGLQEKELLLILADDTRLTPPSPFDEKGKIHTAICWFILFIARHDKGSGRAKSYV